MGRSERITSEIQAHDYKLFCKNMEGKLCIYREGTRVERYDLDDDVVLNFVRPAPSFVMALTHNWKIEGRPVDWGLEPIKARLKAIDLWNRDMAEEIIQQEEKAEKSREREVRTNMEGFLSDFHGKFKETFKDVNTSNVGKRDLRRFKDKTIKG